MFIEILLFAILLIVVLDAKQLLDLLQKIYCLYHELTAYFRKLRQEVHVEFVSLMNYNQDQHLLDTNIFQNSTDYHSEYIKLQYWYQPELNFDSQAELFDNL